MTTKRMKCSIRLTICLICIILLFSACGYSYPEEYTPEHVKSVYGNGTIMPNLYCTSWESKSIRPPDPSAGFRTRFYKISDVALEDFIFGKNLELLGRGYEGIVRHRDCDVNPIMDYEIETIQFLYSGSPQFMEYLSDSTSTFHTAQSIELNEGAICNEVLEAARFDCIWDNNINKEQTVVTDQRYVRDSDEMVSLNYSIRINFKDTSSLVWWAEVYDREGKYYLRRFYTQYMDKEDVIFPCTSYGFYYYVGENFDAFMNEVIT